MGIEPTLSAWEAEVLPLNYTRGKGAILDICRTPSKPPFISMKSSGGTGLPTSAVIVARH